MDQAKTEVPHFIRRDKGSAHLARLPVHITGIEQITAGRAIKIEFKASITTAGRDNLTTIQSFVFY